jgi:hypothetical protein
MQRCLISVSQLFVGIAVQGCAYLIEHYIAYGWLRNDMSSILFLELTPFIHMAQLVTATFWLFQ